MTLLLVAVGASAYESPDLSSEQWSNDMEILLAEIRGRNPDIFDRIDEQTFVADAEELRSTGAALRPRQRAMRLAALLATLQQTHSYVHLTAKTSSLFSRRFGFEMELFAEGFFVTCVAKGNEALFGRKVGGLGDRSPDELLAAIARLSGADNPWSKGILVRRRMNNVDLLRELGALEDDDSLRMTLQDSFEPYVVTISPQSEAQPCHDLRDPVSLTGPTTGEAPNRRIGLR